MKAWSKKEILKKLHPTVACWLNRKFKELTPPQKYAIVPILKNKNVLIAAPTGSGKTLAAFLGILSKLFNLRDRNRLPDGVYCVYVSPLRALNNDIYKNLVVPLKEMGEIEGKETGIRIAVRTGDTPAYEKQKMLRKPPHILITTPETLAIVLNARKFREKLKTVRYVIVDEIHALADNKRGVHLSLSLERLATIARFTRIGLSATIAPLDEVASFLVGVGRKCMIIDARAMRKMDLKVSCPVDDLIYASAEEVNNALYDQLSEIVKKHRTTLIFTNTRSGTERVVWHLKQKLKKVMDLDSIAAHHGSLSRDVRLEVEDRLKKGELKAVVSSTSLELGIDIGYIDVVVQVGSPKSVARCMQRIGRAGHELHRVAKGIMIGMDRDDLVEQAVMTREAYRKHIDKIRIPQNCLDVLAQHVLGMAINKKWKVEEALKVIRRSYCYRNLTKDAFIEVLRYLSGYEWLKPYKVYGKIWFDEDEGVFGRRGKYANVIYTLNVGTIPEETKIDVYTVDKRWVGSIEESFLERLIPGDVFVLAGNTYEFVRARGMKAYVKEAPGIRPTVPSWFSEQLPLTFDLALAIQKFRRKAFAKIEKGESLKDWLVKEFRCDENAAGAIESYLREQYRFMKKFGKIADVFVEDVIEGETQYIVFHTLFGRRVNEALARAYAFALSKRKKRNVGLAVGDTGFVLIIKGYRVKASEILKLVNKNNIQQLLEEAVKRTELLKRRFRHCATRALMILRNYKGHEISLSKQQMSADRLLKVAEDTIVYKETIREILNDFMDLENARKVIDKVRKAYLFKPSTVPSPFAHNLLLIGMSDVVLMEDRKRVLQRFHELVMNSIR